MKLHEVRIAKKAEKVDEPYHEYLRRMARKPHRQQQLGQGAFANVYQHPKFKTIAVKVSEESRRMIDYLAFAIKHRTNPYVPKVFGVRRFRNRESVPYFIVFLEKLQEYEGLSQKRKFDLLSLHVGRNFVNEKIGDVGTAEDFFYEVGMRDIVHYLRSLRKPARHQKHLLQVLEMFMRRRYIDVHDGNVMLRGADQLVFTDPTT